MKISTSKKILLSVLLIGSSGMAFSADLFSLTIDVNGSAGKAAFSSAQDMFDKFDNGGFKSIQGDYTDTSAATAIVDYRSLPIGITAAANSPNIELKIDAIGVTKTFIGSDRNGSLKLLTDFFKKDGGSIISQLQKKLAEVSPIDPIAGNPNSLQSTMVSTGFDQAFSQFATSIKTDAASATASGRTSGNTGASSSNGLVAVGLRFGQYSQQGLTSKSITLPLAYTYRGFENGGQLSFNMPLTYGAVSSSSGTAKTAQGGLGIAYRQPITDKWALTPAVNVAASGSIDLGSVAAMRSVTLASQYSFNHEGYEVSIGNMVGLYSTLKIQTKDFSYDPGIENTIFRNGLMVSHPVTLLNHKDLSLELSFINTQFTGTALYNKWTNELGLTLGTSKSSNLPSYLRMGVTLLQGQKSHGMSANIGYWF
jgi:hypothetical protein